MCSIKKILKEIIEKIEKFNSGLADRKPQSLPIIISMGDYGSLEVTDETAALLIKLTQCWKNQSHELKKAMSDDDWQKAIRAVFGVSLGKCCFSDGSDAADLDELVNNIYLSMKDILAKHFNEFGEKEFIYNASIFRGLNIDSFCIGPVEISSRLAWLDEIEKRELIDENKKSRVLLKLNNKEELIKLPFDNVEYSAYEIISKYNYIINVKLAGFADGSGHEISRLAANLTLSIISLQFPDAIKALYGMYLSIDYEVRKVNTLSIQRGHILSGSSYSLYPFAPHVENDEWQDLLISYKDVFDYYGKILNYLIHPTGKVQQASLLNQFLLSLIWYNQSVRETDSLIGVVKIASALDALGGGKKSKGILNLFEKALPITRDEFISDGITLKVAIETIYDKGRSRMVHGTSDTLGHDWKKWKSIGQYLYIHLFNACIVAATNNNKVDSVEELWV